MPMRVGQGQNVGVRDFARFNFVAADKHRASVFQKHRSNLSILVGNERSWILKNDRLKMTIFCKLFRLREATSIHISQMLATNARSSSPAYYTKTNIYLFKLTRPTFIFYPRTLKVFVVSGKCMREMSRPCVFTKELRMCLHKNECIWYQTALIQDQNAFETLDD